MAADPDQLRAMLEKIAALSEEGPGITRMGYSDLEREAHRMVGGWLADMGCAVWQDAAGSTIAELPGRGEKATALGTGSHLDSVYNGGQFDGIAGVVAGVELVRMVGDTGGLDHPLRVVIFAAEEAARFGRGCLASALAAGCMTRQGLEELTDVDGITLAEAMRRVGVDPKAAAEVSWDPAEWAGFLELHIEQGTVLDVAGEAVAPVDLISGAARVMFTVTGRPTHSGGTPMAGRSDALVAAAEAVLIAKETAETTAHPGTRATVGRLDVSPNSITTIPGEVTFSLDVRDTDAERQTQAAHEIIAKVKAAAAHHRVQVEAEFTGDNPPVILSEQIRSALEQAADVLGLKQRILSSGAGHDSQHISSLMPTGMLFVPSREGLSHVPDEWTDPAQIADGVNVLYRALHHLDTELD